MQGNKKLSPQAKRFRIYNEQLQYNCPEELQILRLTILGN